MNDYSDKVLFVGPDYRLRGGMATVLKVYAESLKSFNFLPTYRYTKNPMALFFFIAALFKLIGILLTRRSIQIVHIHTASRGSFFRKSIVLLTARLFRRKTILHIHGGEFRQFFEGAGIFKSYIRKILNLADELVCLSEEWKEYFAALCQHRPIIVLNNPVIIPQQPAAAYKNELPVNILFLNHINRPKGIFDVLQCVANNKNLIKGSFILTIAGAGKNDELLEFIEREGLGDTVHFRGWVEGEDKNKLLNECDAFILTSYNEGLPVSILEAMARKKAIIATEVGGIPRIVKKGENGWLIKPGDEKALAAIFSNIKEQPSMLESYGNESFRIVQDFSAEKVAGKLNDMYRKLLIPPIT